MEISWYGLRCFRMVERGLASVVTDPYSPKLGLPPLKLKADIVTVSQNTGNHRHLSSVSGSRHVLSGPGEYEIGGVFITAIQTASRHANGRNILYLFDFGRITVAHLGKIDKVPTQSQIEQLGDVNVLLAPVGAGDSLNAAKAAELVSMIEPNIVVPMFFQQPNAKAELEDVDRFVNEMGLTDVEEETSLRLSASKLPEETQTIILQPKI